MFNSILIVCTANICRSPMAEVIFRKLLPNHTICSAGTCVSTLNFDDMPADKNARLVAQQFELDLEQHRAQQLTPELIDQYDLVLVMNRHQLEEVAEVIRGARSKTLLIGQWIQLGDIADPYGKGLTEFEQCYKTLERAALSWSKKCVR